MEREQNKIWKKNKKKKKKKKILLKGENILVWF